MMDRILIAAMLVLAIALAVDAPEARATSNDSVAIEASRSAPALSLPLTNPRNFTISCTDPAVPIVPTTGRKQFRWYECTNDTATAVFVGGSTVDGTTYGRKICNTAATCPSGNEVELEGAGEYCFAAAPTNLNCRFAD